LVITPPFKAAASQTDRHLLDVFLLLGELRASVFGLGHAVKRLNGCAATTKSLPWAACSVAAAHLAVALGMIVLGLCMVRRISTEAIHAIE